MENRINIRLKAYIYALNEVLNLFPDHQALGDIGDIR